MSTSRVVLIDRYRMEAQVVRSRGGLALAAYALRDYFGWAVSAWVGGRLVTTRVASHVHAEGMLRLIAGCWLYTLPSGPITTVDSGGAPHMPKDITAKVFCSNKREISTGTADHHFSVEFRADYADERNKEWAKYTPALSLMMTLNPEAGALFEMDKRYTLTFTEEPTGPETSGQSGEPLMASPEEPSESAAVEPADVSRETEPDQVQGQHRAAE